MSNWVDSNCRSVGKPPYRNGLPAELVDSCCPKHSLGGAAVKLQEPLEPLNAQKSLQQRFTDNRTEDGSGSYAKAEYEASPTSYL